MGGGAPGEKEMRPAMKKTVLAAFVFVTLVTLIGLVYSDYIKLLFIVGFFGLIGIFGVSLGNKCPKCHLWGSLGAPALSKKKNAGGKAIILSVYARIVVIISGVRKRPGRGRERDLMSVS